VPRCICIAPITRLPSAWLNRGQALGEQGVAAFHKSLLALLAEKRGDVAWAIAHWEQVRHLARKIGDHPGVVARTRRHLAALAFARGDLAQARTLLEENLTLGRQTG
jgi:hypothetical protein